MDAIFKRVTHALFGEAWRGYDDGSERLERKMPQNGGVDCRKELVHCLFMCGGGAGSFTRDGRVDPLTNDGHVFREKTYCGVA